MYKPHLSDQDRNEQCDRIVELHRRLYRLVGVVQHQEWMSLGLTMPQFKAMLHLWSVGSCRIGEMASEVGLRLSVATGIVDRLESQGLMERLPVETDGRGVLCALTPDGRKMVSRVTQTRSSVFNSLLEDLSPQQLELVEASAEVLLAAAERQMTPDTLTKAPPSGSVIHA